MFKSKQSKNSRKKSDAELYPDLPPELREEAVANLHSYFEVVYGIFLDLEAQGVLDEVLEKNRLKQEWEKRSK